MALTKVQKTGITDNAIDADKIEDGTIVAADIAPGTITNAKLAGSIANDKLANSSITVNGSSVSLGGSVTAGKVQWQAVKTTDFNAVAGEGYFVDTDSVGAVTATLPGSASAGDTIAIKDYAANFGTNSLTIARNGNNIQGVANDSEISTNRASVVLVYIDATKGWLFTNESNVAVLGPTFISATGGTITQSGDYQIHTFTGDGCFVVSSLGGGSTPCAVASTVDYLVVAGGGAGAKGHGGGGGAGGFRESKDSTLSSPHTASPLAATTGITVSASTYPITVGAGGAGAPATGDCSPYVQTSGSNSVFSTITSAGGGKGGGWCAQAGANGGSGGGGGGPSSPTTTGYSGNTPPTSPPQGNNGGNGTSPGSGGGGGGATTTGGNSTSPGPNANGGPGGTGATTTISGSPTAYAGGGGGGNYFSPGVGGTGGTGGGGSGSNTPADDAQAGTANTGGGGGGGGANYTKGAGGGKGLVIIRYKYQ
jgi:hypothetical protein